MSHELFNVSNAELLLINYKNYALIYICNRHTYPYVYTYNQPIRPSDIQLGSRKNQRQNI